MKLALTLFASVFGMEGHGKLDDDNIHIGGGAFDPGTTDGLALWAIRKCKKKVCAVWPWAQCPLTDISDMTKSGRKTRGPCCHKCWNKCPPYLARHRDNDHGVFGNAAKRRYLKDEVWKFLQNDIECETSRLKDEFMDVSNVGLNMEAYFGTDGENMGMLMMQNTEGIDGEVEETRDEACDEKFGWYQCNGHKFGHCCSNGCLNNPDKSTGKCGVCNCNGKCDYRDRMLWTLSESTRMNCHLPPPPPAEEEEEEEEVIEEAVIEYEAEE